ncbi:Crp/Fnr family transcriptional regulator [Hyphomicrobium sp. LHD-15]|uniref:Crp/Fnr family transcriptional regulator n=1 Tax=Hyphomicrobium sp. LHD-15 TaxID=3072142 RepID=UPI00280D93D2|nr:Crp/Fnr family transcriptional regulator [Hyphomicrobium sp. LHD-15]MDQ8698237.1 Crp/Fnr family transcriptional regulator [Hyphomicrobium sp. LHD-15]
MKVDRIAVRSLPLFERMSDVDLDSFLDHASSWPVLTGETVFKQGELATSFYLLLSGRLKVTQVTGDGQQFIVRVVHPGELFGFAKALQRPDYPATATAVMESVVLSWPSNLWSQFVEQNGRLAVSAIETMGKQLEEAHSRIREMSTEEVERRIAHVILRLSLRAGRKEESGIRINFPISRQDIAEMTGTTLYTVSRVLTAWEARGLVKGGRQKIVICDLPGLSLLSEGARD